MLSVGVKSQKLVLDFVTRMSNREDPGPIDPLNISGAMLALAKAMGADREAVAAGPDGNGWNDVMIAVGIHGAAHAWSGEPEPAAGGTGGGRPPLQGRSLARQ